MITNITNGNSVDRDLAQKHDFQESYLEMMEQVFLFSCRPFYSRDLILWGTGIFFFLYTHIYSIYLGLTLFGCLQCQWFSISLELAFPLQPHWMQVKMSSGLKHSQGTFHECEP